MSVFSGHSGGTLKKLAIHKNSSAYAFAHRNCNQVLNVLGVSTKPYLCQRTRARSVFQVNGYAHGHFQRTLKIHIVPAEIWRKDQILVCHVNPSGQTHSDSGKFNAMLFGKFLSGDHKTRDEFFRRTDGFQTILRNKPAAHIGNRQARECWANVNSQNPFAITIKMQNAGFAAARGIGKSAFGDPLLFDQLFNNKRYSAELQAGMPCEVGPADGLMRTQKIENYAPVDVAGSFARGYLEILKINLTHRICACYTRRFPLLLPLTRIACYQLRLVSLQGAGKFSAAARKASPYAQSYFFSDYPERPFDIGLHIAVRRRSTINANLSRWRRQFDNERRWEKMQR
jgi:hypothetical protein